MPERPIKVDRESYHLADLAARVNGDTKKELASEAIKTYIKNNEKLMKGIKTLEDFSKEEK